MKTKLQTKAFKI